MEFYLEKIRIGRILKTFFVFFVAFNLAFLPVYPALAEEITEPLAEETQAPEESADDTEETQNEEEEEPADENDEDGAGIETGDALAEADSENSINTNTAEEDIVPVDPVDGADNADTQEADLAETAGSPEALVCDCENLNSGESEEENNSEDAENEEDPCLLECEGAVVQENSAESASNAVEAASDTGNNEISAQNDTALVQNDTEEDSTQNDPVNSPAANTGQDTEEIQNDTEENNVQNDTEEDNVQSDTENETAGAAIIAGDALAEAAAVNEVNTNVVAENSVTQVENITGDYEGDIDLLEVFNSLLDGAQDLNEQNEEAIEISVVNINKAVLVENSVSAEANSGENTIENADGSASIATGAAQAAASAVNIINTNIVGDNWLFAIINIIGNWTGDLIVPGEGLLSTLSSGMLFGKVVNVNEASDIENSVSAEASSGGNSISGSDGNATIATGESQASASAVNLVNTNIVKNNWFFLMINNAGNWTGRIVNWDGENQNNVYEFDFGSADPCSSEGMSQITNVYNYNSAVSVSNTVKAMAGTGNNSISGAGDSSITTGNASAWAGAINLVNTNIVGNNWFFGLVNNAGNWNGDVVFAYPDLAVNIDDEQDTANPGDELDYWIDLANLGHADAENVRVALDFPEELEYESDTSGGRLSTGDGGYSWDFSGLEAGEEESFSVKFKVSEAELTDPKMLEVEAYIDTDTKEVYFDNNSSLDETWLENEEDEEDEYDDDYEDWEDDYDSKLSIRRKSDSGETVKPGQIVRNSIWIKNSGDGDLYEIEVADKMKNQNGEDLGTFIWPIDYMPEGETAVIDYEIMINDSGYPLTILSSVRAEAKDPDDHEIKSRKLSSVFSVLIPSAYAAEEGEIIKNPETSEVVEAAEVLGAEDLPKNSLPLWIWLFAAASYFLAVNWSLFPKKETSS